MSNPSCANQQLLISLSLVLVLGSLQAQTTAPAAGMNMPKMAERCEAMKQHKQKMSEDIKAQNGQLTGEVNRMNRTPSDQKVGLMASVLTHIVEQRVSMDARKAAMEDEMMQHMMQHMQMGKEAMAQCPMMSGMKGMADKPTAGHKH